MNEAPQPRVSVIVPAHDEARFVGACIASIRATRWPADALEVIVIDNRSQDDTAEAAARAGAAVIRDQSTSIGAVRNVGLQAARHEYLAYVDADCTVPPTWLASAVRLLESDLSVGAVGGPCIAPAEGSWVERALAPVRLSWSGSRVADSLATSSFVARTALLRELGGFNEKLASGEDSEMSARLRQRGLTLRSLADCCVVHYGYPDTWMAFLRKQIWHGSSHLEARTGLDLTLLLSHLALLGLVVLAAAVPLAFVDLRAGLLAALFATAALALPALVYSAKRTVQAAGAPRAIFRWGLLGIAYFVGRALGLARNYWRRLT